MLLPLVNDKEFLNTLYARCEWSFAFLSYRVRYVIGGMRVRVEILIQQRWIYSCDVVCLFLLYISEPESPKVWPNHQEIYNIGRDETCSKIKNRLSRYMQPAEWLFDHDFFQQFETLWFAMQIHIFFLSWVGNVRQVTNSVSMQIQWTYRKALYIYIYI